MIQKINFRLVDLYCGRKVKLGRWTA